MSWLVEWKKPASLIGLAGFMFGILGVAFTAGGDYYGMKGDSAAQAAINAGVAERLTAVEGLAATNGERNDLQGDAIMAIRDDLVETKTNFVTTLSTVDATSRDLIASVNQLAGKVDLISRIIARTTPLPAGEPIP